MSDRLIHLEPIRLLAPNTIGPKAEPIGRLVMDLPGPIAEPAGYPFDMVVQPVYDYNGAREQTWHGGKGIIVSTYA